MIDLGFQAGADAIQVRIMGNKVFFMRMVGGIPYYRDLSEIKLPVEGIIKAYPDIKGSDDEIRKQGTKRLQDHIKNMDSPTKIMHYVIAEMEKLGALHITTKRAGFRPIINKENTRKIIRKAKGLED